MNVTFGPDGPRRVSRELTGRSMLQKAGLHCYRRGRRRLRFAGRCRKCCRGPHALIEAGRER